MRACFLVAVLLGGVSTGVADDDATLLSADVTASPARDGGYVVRQTYEISPHEAQRLEISLLSPTGELPRRIEGWLDDRPQALVLEGTTPHWTGAIELSRAALGETLRLVFEYEMRQLPTESPTSVELELPLIVVHAPPLPTGEETFRATVFLPSGSELVRSFPVNFRRGTTDVRGTRYEVALPVVPAFLTLSGSTEGAPLLTTGRAMDLLAVLMLVTLGALGWRRFRTGLS